MGERGEDGREGRMGAPRREDLIKLLNRADQESDRVIHCIRRRSPAVSFFIMSLDWDHPLDKVDLLGDQDDQSLMLLLKCFARSLEGRPLKRCVFMCSARGRQQGKGIVGRLMRVSLALWCGDSSPCLLSGVRGGRGHCEYTIILLLMT